MPELFTDSSFIFSLRFNSVILVFTTAAPQFNSTVLLADFMLGNVDGPLEIVPHRYTLTYPQVEGLLPL
jgi:hypothetical protein